MCGRYTLHTSVETIAALFSGLPAPTIEPAYNIAPTEVVTAIRQIDNEPPEFTEFRWGLIPYWANDVAIGNRMINARADTLHNKPAFREPFQKRRCLVLADGFYEWKKTDAGKQPVYIQLKNREPFCFAGLWDTNSKLDNKIQSCTIVTTSPNELVSPIHDRMPAILPKSRYSAWLDPHFSDLDALTQWLAPYPSNEMRMTSVDKKVNRATYKEADCISPAKVQQDLNFL